MRTRIYCWVSVCLGYRGRGRVGSWVVLVISKVLKVLPISSTMILVITILTIVIVIMGYKDYNN